MTGGKPTVAHDMLKTRSTVIPIKDVATATYKLNAETTGVCETCPLLVLYEGRNN